MNEEPIRIQHFPYGAVVTVLVYDLVNTNPEANAAIKRILKGENQEQNDTIYGWNDTIPSILVRQLAVIDRYRNGEAMPSTTLWKAGVDPTQAVAEFEQVLYAYNTNNKLNPRIEGKAVAFSTNQYSALLRL